MEEKQRTKRTKAEMAIVRAEYEAKKQEKLRLREEAIASRAQKRQEREERRAAREYYVANKAEIKLARQKEREARRETKAQNLAQHRASKKADGLVWPDPILKAYAGNVLTGDEVYGSFAGERITGKVIRISTIEDHEKSLTDDEISKVWDKSTIRYIVAGQDGNYPLSRNKILGKKINNIWKQKEN